MEMERKRQRLENKSTLFVQRLNAKTTNAVSNLFGVVQTKPLSDLIGLGDSRQSHKLNSQLNCCAYLRLASINFVTGDFVLECWRCCCCSCCCLNIGCVPIRNIEP